MLSGFTRFYDCQWTTYKIISVTHNRLLKTQIFENKSIFTAKKFFRPIFTCITDYGRPQVTCYPASQRFMVVIEQVIRSFLYYLIGCWKHKFLMKKSIFPAKKFLRPFFLVLLSRTDLREQFVRVHNVFWHLLGKIQDHFFRTYEVIWKNFSKKLNFPNEKQFWSLFLVLPSMADLR